MRDKEVFDMRSKSKKLMMVLLTTLLTVLLCAAFVACGETEQKPGPEPGPEPEATLVKLTLTAEPRSEYREGETFDLTGCKAEAEWSDGNVDKLSTRDLEVSPDRALLPTDTSVTISYESVSVEFPITVTPLQVESLSVNWGLFKTSYAEGDVITFTGLDVTATVQGGDTVDVIGYTVKMDGEVVPEEGIAPEAGEHTVVVEYKGVSSAEQKILVFDGYTIEAANIYKKGEAPTDVTESYVEAYDAPNAKCVAEANEEFSGIGYLGGFDGGDTVRFHIYAEVEMKVDLIIKISNANITKFGPGGYWNPIEISEVQLNNLVNAYVVTNDGGEESKTPIAIDDSVKLEGQSTDNPQGDVKLLNIWQTVSFGEMDLKAGYNVIEFGLTTNIPKTGSRGYVGCNIDELELRMIQE